jgi:hypothetical protein
MARFTRKVEFRAYQFNPEEVKGMDDDDIEDVIIEALALTDGVKSAFVTTEGKLDVVLYTYGRENTKEHFELSPGEWLTTAITGLADFEVITDEAFQGFATPVQ